MTNKHYPNDNEEFYPTDKELKEIMKKDKHERVMLIKKFKEYDDKVIYTGTRRGAEKRIPKSKKKQYKIISIKD